MIETLERLEARLNLVNQFPSGLVQFKVLTSLCRINITTAQLAILNWYTVLQLVFLRVGDQTSYFLIFYEFIL